MRWPKRLPRAVRCPIGRDRSAGPTQTPLRCQVGGKENAVNERPDGDKRLTGLRGALQFAALPNLDCYASFGKQYGRYDNSNFAFDYMRRDIQTEAAAGLVWRMIGDVSVRPGISYTRNRSNIEINDYRRTEYLLTVRYDIR